MGIADKISDIELEMRRMQKNKATEYHRGLLRAKLSRYKAQLEINTKEANASSKGDGFDVARSGDARVALIGFPSVGKSTLMNILTNAESRAASYEFTTLTCIPGIIEYRQARIQLLDLPGIIEGAATGKGRGKQVISVARTADLIVIMLDATKALKHKNIIENELETMGIRLNQEKPNISYTPLKSSITAGVKVSSLVPLTKITKTQVINILHESKIYNAEVIFNKDYGIQEFVDVLQNNCVYIPCLYVYNKIDQLSIEHLDHYAKQCNNVVLSCNLKLNIDYFLYRLWRQLGLIIIYTRKQGEKPNLEEGIIARSGATLQTLCGCIHRTFAKRFRFALVWGRSVKFMGQRVGIKHVLANQDVVQIVLN
ncbi:hypothetical protein A3Q56_04312 [Intoshia linei]|uniref:Developmentally-regulated GTP-binding protein 2 n=1 Tax=Intoshia linei TaxID=1819745 RepID=A0A177B115_9BILA|nr:hypothetical protein A3Q56_04312 [Intoshia linei]